MSRKGESRLREDVCKALRKRNLTVSTVEGGGMGGTPGIPDVHYAGHVEVESNVFFGYPAFSGYIEGWIELKVLRGDEIAARARNGDIPVVSGLGHYTAQQRVWHTKHSRAGGRVHLFMRVDHEVPWFYCYEGAWAAERLGRDLFMREFSSWSTLDERHDPRKFPDPDHLVRALLRREPVRKPLK